MRDPHRMNVSHILPHKMCCSHLVRLEVASIMVQAISWWLVNFIGMSSNVPAFMDGGQLGSDLVLPAFFKLF